LRLATKFRALGHGTTLPAIFNSAAFGVIDALPEAALIGFFVDFGAAHLLATTHHVNGGFLTTHQLAHDLIYQAVF
jgi:hypothetical protein